MLFSWSPNIEKIGRKNCISTWNTVYIAQKHRNSVAAHARKVLPFSVTMDWMIGWQSYFLNNKYINNDRYHYFQLMVKCVIKLTIGDVLLSLTTSTMVEIGYTLRNTTTTQHRHTSASCSSKVFSNSTESGRLEQRSDTLSLPSYRVHGRDQRRI